MRESAKKFNRDGNEFPASWKDIDKFEKQNDYAISMVMVITMKFVYCIQGKSVTGMKRLMIRK